MLAMLNIFSISICDLGIPKNAQTKNATLRKKKIMYFPPHGFHINIIDNYAMVQ